MTASEPIEMTICAWCLKEQDLLDPTALVSHSICDRHYAEQLRDAGIPEDAVQAALQRRQTTPNNQRV